ncbi:MAG TPA: YegP family protein [Rhodanobacteraceae bacterium]
MSGKFECSVGHDGKHRFNLKASNGQVILTSQGYTQHASCLAGIESVRKHGVQHDRFEKKTSTDGKFYFVLKASNGQVIGTSQRYASEASCDNGIESVKNHAPGATLADAT